MSAGKKKRVPLKTKAKKIVKTVSAILLEAEGKIISVWETRVREEIPLAGDHSSSVIRNSLPNFIIGLAATLTEGEGTDVCTRSICEEHGEQRAQKTFYSADQVVHEYRLLREVLFEVMEQKVALDGPTVQAIHLAIDYGVAEALKGFIRLAGDERALAKEKLFENEERYNLALRAGKIGVWEMSLRAPRILCTSRQFKIFGVEPGAGDEMSFDDFQQSLHAEDRLPMSREIAEAVREKRDFFLEHRVVWPDGKVRWVRASGRPYFDENGEPTRMLGTSIDITSARAEQEQRRELIASLTREQEIREKFVSALTHDLRTPLTAAKMSGQLVARMAHRPDDVVRLASRVVDNINRADEMISDLLDASRIRAGLPLELQLHECEIKSLLQATLEELTIIHGNRFVLDGQEGARGYWDANGLRRILENLCNNAVKYGDAHTPILVSFSCSRDQLELSVRNRGKMLRDEEKQGLFTLFQRTESARSLGGKGWGIGLTVVKGIAESHGGTVKVDSDAEGTIFTVNLPIDARLHRNSGS